MKMKRYLLLGIWFCWGLGGWAQEHTFNEGYDLYRPYGYQPVWKWKHIRSVYHPDVAYQDSLYSRIQGKEYSFFLCPWWLEDLYQDSLIAQGLKGRLEYIGYVLDPWTGAPELVNEWNNNQGNTILQSPWYQNTPLDLTVYCRSGAAFDCFLRSEKARLNFLHQVFEWRSGMINRYHGKKRTDGINFYLPDFTFQEKRAFTHFIKSVSMVIDSLSIEGGHHPYTGDSCKLYVTLAAEAKQEIHFLSGIAEFVDAILFVDYDACGLPVARVEELNKANDETPLVIKLYNQFYLFDLKDNRDLTGQVCGTDIDKLAKADYDDYHWAQYFYLDLLLFLIWVGLLIAYYTSSRFYIFADCYRFLIVPVMITFVTEIFILFLFMLEAISLDVLLFKMEESTHYLLLLLPVVFIVFHIFIRLLNQRKVLP